MIALKHGIYDRTEIRLYRSISRVLSGIAFHHAGLKNVFCGWVLCLHHSLDLGVTCLVQDQRRNNNHSSSFKIVLQNSRKKMEQTTSNFDMQTYTGPCEAYSNSKAL